jgi:hypothetical protein
VGYPALDAATRWARDDFEAPMRARRRIAIGIVLSLLVHGLLLVLTPRRMPVQGAPAQSVQGPLEVRLSEAAPPAPAQAAEPQPDRNPKPRPAPRRDAVIAALVPAPQSFRTPVEPPAPSAPTPEPFPTAPMDMMALINARRRAIESAAARENAQARSNSREPSANDTALASINRNLQTITRENDGTSGVFQILSMGTRTAEFSFRGWTPDARSKWREVYEVDAGPRGDIERAVVRKMIELIRSHYQGNFNWDSHRLDRIVVLSARMEDNDGLEAFMMREFFGPGG